MEIHSSKERAKAEIDKWKTDLSVRIESKYRPSGKTTLLTILIMIGASIVTPISGILAGLLFILMKILVGGFFSVIEFIVGITIVGEIAKLIMVIAIVYGMPYMFIAGAAGAWITASGLIFGKDRSVVIPLLLTVAATIASAYVFEQTIYRLKDIEIPTINLIFGYIITPIGAAIFSVYASLNLRKFCEGCQIDMNEEKSLLFPLTAGRELASIIDNREFYRLSTIDHSSATDQKHCFLNLFVCPKCNNGYLEARAHLESKWEESGQEKAEVGSKEVNWLFRSIKIDSSQTVAIKDKLEITNPSTK